MNIFFFFFFWQKSWIYGRKCRFFGRKCSAQLLLYLIMYLLVLGKNDHDHQEKKSCAINTVNLSTVQHFNTGIFKRRPLWDKEGVWDFITWHGTIQVFIHKRSCTVRVVRYQRNNYPLSLCVSHLCVFNDNIWYEIKGQPLFGLFKGSQLTFVNCGHLKNFFTAPWLKNLVEYSYLLPKYSVKISREKKWAFSFYFTFL